VSESTAIVLCEQSASVQREIISRSPQAREQRGQQLASVFVKFISDCLPLLVQVRQDFFEKPSDDTICGVKTFDDYCTGVLRYSRRRIQQLIQGSNPASVKHNGSANRKPPTLPITDAEFAQYEAEYNNGIRKSAKNLLDHKGMTPTDVVGALVGMSIPEPMAEAAVRIVAGPQPPSKPKRDLRPDKKTASELDGYLKTHGVDAVVNYMSEGEGYFGVTLRGLTESQVRQLPNRLSDFFDSAPSILASLENIG
jgi:hypothetical protein